MPWARAAVETCKPVTCLAFLADRLTVRLENPEREPALKQLLQSLREADPAAALFAKSRLFERKISYQQGYEDRSPCYRVTIPIKQRQYLSLEAFHYEICLVPRPEMLEIWSMRRVEDCGIPSLG